MQDRIDIIINKAKRAGINVGIGSNIDKIQSIASALGFSDEDIDLDTIEDTLNDLLDGNEEIELLEDDSDDYEEYNIDSKHSNVNKNTEDNLEENNTEEKNKEENSDEKEEDKKEEKEESTDESHQDHNKSKNTQNNREDLTNESRKRSENKVQEAKNKLKNINQTKEEKRAATSVGTETVKKAATNKAGLAKKAGSGLASITSKAGQAIASAGKAIVSFIVSNPIVAAVIAIAILIILILVMYMSTDKDFSDGYFDSACNYNLTTVNYDCSPNSENVSLKDFVIGSAYAYTKDKDFSKNATKALMIAIKTSALASGGYNSSSKQVKIGCNISYEKVSNIPSDTLDDLKDEYEDIERYLFISESYDGSSITNLSGGSNLNLSEDTIQKFEAASGSYEGILKDVYGSNNNSNNNVKVDATRDTIYIGDSRMAGMVLDGIIPTEKAAYLGANGYCWFRYNTNYGSSCSPYWNSNTNVSTGGILAANSKMQSGQDYNIIIWLGVNDLGNINNYFNVYKELAEGEWSNHNIFIAQVGPVNESKYSQAAYAVKNSQVEEFNNNMSSLISSANLSNLIYLDLGLTQDKINWNESDGVHYNKTDYQMIYDLFQSTSGASGKKVLYDLGDYCAFYESSTGCESDWWWPIGSSEATSGDIYGGQPMYTAYSPYGPRDCNIGMSCFHSGADLNCGGQIGVPVIATKSGTVTVADDAGCADLYNHGGQVCSQNRSGYGNYIMIDHGDNIVSLYGHLTSGSFTVKTGDHVSQGQLIARTGSTGSSTGPHLHFEIRLNGAAVDPLKYVNPDNPRPQVCSYTSDKKGVCEALKRNNLTDNAIAGLLVNIGAEGGFKTNNLENCYETGKCCQINGNYGYCVTGYLIGDYGSDEAYTEGVSSGKYQNFAIDRAGYGLIQWTTEGRKQGLLDYYNMMKARGEATSIADVNVQIGYLLQELNSGNYSISQQAVYNPDSSAYDVAYNFCLNFERPAGLSATCAARASANVSYYEKFVQNDCNE